MHVTYFRQGLLACRPLGYTSDSTNTISRQPPPTSTILSLDSFIGPRHNLFLRSVSQPQAFRRLNPSVIAAVEAGLRSEDGFWILCRGKKPVTVMGQPSSIRTSALADILALR